MSKKYMVIVAAATMALIAPLGTEPVARAAPQRVVEVQHHSDGTSYVRFLNGTGCTGHGYIVNAGAGPGTEQVLALATAALLSKRPVRVELVSTVPTTSRCKLASLTLL